MSNYTSATRLLVSLAFSVLLVGIITSEELQHDDYESEISIHYSSRKFLNSLAPGPQSDTFPRPETKHLSQQEPRMVKFHSGRRMESLKFESQLAPLRKTSTSRLTQGVVLLGDMGRPLPLHAHLLEDPAIKKPLSLISILQASQPKLVLMIFSRLVKNF